MSTVRRPLASMVPLLVGPVRACLGAGALAAMAIGMAQPARAALFSAVEVDQSKFVIVLAPIGDGSRAQLNIYEQRTAARPCFAVQGGAPAVVNPLLASFDFTGICNRFIDANGYSVRVGGDDLATVYRLTVLLNGSDDLLLAVPTKPGAGPEMVVARTGGHAAGFLQFQPEPGWKIMRRQFGGRALGHVYLYRDSWPAAEALPLSPAPASGGQPARERGPEAVPTKPEAVPVKPEAVQVKPGAVSPQPADTPKPGRKNKPAKGATPDSPSGSPGAPTPASPVPASPVPVVPPVVAPAPAPVTPSRVKAGSPGR